MKTYDNGMELAQFNSDGSPNTSFGTSGLVTITAAGQQGPTGLGLVQAPDGDLMVGY